MASNGTYALKINVTGNVTSYLQKTNKQLALMNKPFKDFQRQFSQFKKNIGFDALSKSINRIISPLKTASKYILGIFGASSVAGVIAMTRQFSMLSNEIQRTAAGLGISTNKLQGLSDAGKLLGTGSNSLPDVLKKIQDNNQNLKFGGDANLQTAYQKINASYKNSPDEVMKKLLDYTQEHQKKGDISPAQLRLLHQTVLGNTDYIGKSYDDVKGAEDRAKTLGRYNQDNINNANKLRQSFEGVGIAISGFTQTIIGKLAPVFSPLLDKFANWLATSPQANQMIEQITASAQKFADWISKVNWTEVGNEIAYWYDKIGGFKTVIAGLIILNVAGWFAGILSVATSLFGMFTKIGKLSLFSKLGDLSKSVPAGAGAAEGAIKSLSKAFGGLNLAITAVTTAWDLFNASKEKDPLKKSEGYGKAIGSGVGGLLGGAAGSFVGPGGTIIGGMAGSWLGGKLGGMVGNAMFTGPGQASEKLTTDDQNKRAAYLVQQAMQAGYSKNAALGIVGNVSQESGFNAGANGDGGHAWGIGQWHSPRVQDILKGTGIDVRKAGYADQVKAYLWEMQHGPDRGARRAGQLLMQTPDISVGQAAAAVKSQFERPADLNGTEALNRTQQAIRYENDARFQKAMTDHNLSIEISGAPQGTTATVKNGGNGLNIPAPKIKTAPVMGDGMR